MTNKISNSISHNMPFGFINFLLSNGLYTVICFLLVSISGVSQNWSSPVTIYSGGYNCYSDFTISSNGTFYCVWSKMIKYGQFYKIFLSKSDNNGNTWSAMEDVAQNTSKWLSNPQIQVDMLDNIYVSYNYDLGNYTNTSIYIKKFFNGFWHDPVMLSQGFPGVQNNSLFMDHNNRLYCFWNMGMTNTNFFYKYKNIMDSSWSEVIQPFSNSASYWISDVAIGKDNVLHCAGTHQLNNFPNSDRQIYFTCTNNNWSDYAYVGDTLTGTERIALDQNNIPSCLVSHYFPDSMQNNFGLSYTKLTGESWPQGQTIAPEYASEYDLAIDINGNPHIVDNEKVDTNNQLVHYYHDSIGWHRMVLEQNKYKYFSNKLILSGSTLNWIYIRIDSISYSTAVPFTSIHFRKLEIINGIDLNISEAPLKIFPNPTSHIVNIEIPSTVTTIFNISIYNNCGKLVRDLATNEKPNYTRRMVWDGKDINGIVVPSGLYYMHYSSGKVKLTQSLILL